MKFGWLASHESYQPEVLVDLAVDAERLGFDAVFASDHFHPWVDQESASGFVWSWLGAVAARTSRIELVTSVTCPLFHYHPAMIAQSAATVDRLSGGRFLLGVGTGENINEGPMGIPFPAYPERIERMGEALHIIEALLAGKKVHVDGKYYSAEAARLYSPPVSKVPVLMAAGGPKSAAFAGARADGVITSVKDPEQTLDRVIRPFQSAATEAGKPSPVVATTRWVVFAQNDSEAWKALGTMRGLRAPGRLEVVDPMILRQRADELDRSEILDQFMVVSNADELVEAYRPLISDLGADYVSVQVASVDPKTTLELVGKQVLPRLRQLSEDR